MRQGALVMPIRVTCRAVILLAASVMVAGVLNSEPAAAASAGRTSTQSPRRVYTIKDGVRLPDLVQRVGALYTPAAKRRRIQGSVWLDCVVNRRGYVRSVAVVGSLDAKYGLDRSAVSALKRWLFKPGTLKGEPVDIRVTVEVRFHLD